jgi:hypothetical protein
MKNKCKTCPLSKSPADCVMPFLKKMSKEIQKLLTVKLRKNWRKDVKNK